MAMATRLRNHVVVLCVCAAVLAAASACTSTPSAPARSGSASGDASSSGQRAVSPDLGGRIQDFLDLDYSGGFDHIRAILVSVDGRMVFERYYHSSVTTTGNVFSVTKSVMSTLIGIALDEGRLRSADQTLAQLLPAHTRTMSSQLRQVTLRQILTMTAGLPRDPPDLPPFATTDNWVAAILQDGTDQPPGQSFAYSSAGSHLLSAILTEATGRSTLDYAREKLLNPLGIDTVPAAEPVARQENLAVYNQASFAWPTDPQGTHVGFSFLKLTGRDMDKLGRLWLNKGRWNGRQLVSASWVAESTRPHVETNSTPERYGYQLWVTTAGDHRAYAAIGSGGQLIEVVPDLGLVVVVASADETGAAAATAYLDLVADYVAPAVGR
jgi:CubicO group peptidase (beta-lactamase class C family)